jgi:hypothetical protein
MGTLSNREKNYLHRIGFLKKEIHYIDTLYKKGDPTQYQEIDLKNEFWQMKIRSVQMYTARRKKLGWSDYKIRLNRSLRDKRLGFGTPIDEIKIIYMKGRSPAKITDYQQARQRNIQKIRGRAGSRSNPKGR